MLIERFSKQPAENRRYVVDYSKWLASGETIKAVTAAVTEFVPADEQALRDADPTRETNKKVLVTGLAAIVPAKTAVAFFAGRGVDGVIATITLTVTTTDLQVKEDEVELSIDEV